MPDTTKKDQGMGGERHNEPRRDESERPASGQPNRPDQGHQHPGQKNQ
jgi:hypothetical protein